MTTIYVSLLDEGTDVWRPVEAVEVGQGCFRITSPSEPADEAWQFKPGEIVRCEVRRLSGGECFVAVARLSSDATSADAIRVLEAALAHYIAELSESADRTHRAEDRSRYQAHLAKAARMFKALKHDNSLNELRSIIAQERHSYGWSFLADEEGHRAEAAFDRFATLVERQLPAV